MLTLDFSCSANAIKSSPQRRATDMLLQQVEEYFSAGYKGDKPNRVHRTSLPPIYFQHPGHSMTIIGYAKLSDNTKHLIVFDPMYRDSPNILKYVDKKISRCKAPEDRLRAYLRGASYLKRFNEFELLR